MIAAMFAQATPPSSQTTAPTPPSTPDLLPAAPPEPALDKIGKWIDGFYFLLPNLAVAAAVLALIFLLGVMAKWGVVAWGRHRGRDNLGEVLGGFVKWTVVGVGILVAMTIVFPSVRPVDLLAGLGVGSVAVGFAFQGYSAELACRPAAAGPAAVSGRRRGCDHGLRRNGGAYRTAVDRSHDL